MKRNNSSRSSRGASSDNNEHSLENIYQLGYSHGFRDASNDEDYDDEFDEEEYDDYGSSNSPTK